ncbi:MAG: copper resistance protein B [Pseudomonadota bacterium]
MGDDDPVLTMVKVDKFEVSPTSADASMRLEGEGWAGYDLNKLWFTTDVEGDQHGTETAELELYYSRAIAPFWDLQAGLRRDFRPRPGQDWLALGVKGLAPYFFEMDAVLYAADGDDFGVDVSIEYELLFTQRLILSPEVEVTAFSFHDRARGQGDGLSTLEAGLRLRYEVRREFAPYVGIHWEKLYGGTADYAQEEGEDDSDVTLVVGIRAWF